MFFGVSHLDYPTTDLARTRRLFIDVLGFRVAREQDGLLDVDTGNVLLRLMEVSRVEHRTNLRVQTSDVAEALQRLTSNGLALRRAPEHTDQEELVASATDTDGHVISVWRELTEDELEVAPPLPTETRWAPDAEALMQQLLKGVPALFRALARRKVVREAESLAGRDRTVGREEVVRGFILANARITRHRARTPLERAGIDPSRYQADFEAP